MLTTTSASNRACTAIDDEARMTAKLTKDAATVIAPIDSIIDGNRCDDLDSARTVRKSIDMDSAYRVTGSRRDWRENVYYMTATNRGK